jgi:formate dehydrogenase major subunit
MSDGPLPTHYEPLESPVPNLLYKQQSSPVVIYWDRPDNRLAAVGDPNYPIVMTTYRLTEHHLAGGMTRWLPWLAELQPELFIEMSPELAQEKGVKNLDLVKVTTLRGTVQAKALVTPRLRPLQVNGRTLHLIGAPWHFGYMGLAVGDVVNNLTPMLGDPNVTIHEAKAFLANLERA